LSDHSHEGSPELAALAPVKTPIIGIIGGKGRMGRWFHRFFEDQGFHVIISDIDTRLAPEDVAIAANVVILSLPMNIFPEVVKQVGPLVPEEHLLTDFCSLKQTQVECMLENSRCEVIGTHPLFGPGEPGIEGHRVAICPARGERWLPWWKRLFQLAGAATPVFTPQEHDRTMAWVQALNHFVLLCLGKSLEEDGIDFRHVIELATPSFARQLDILARLCFQDPELYAFIQMANPYTDAALETFDKYARQLRSIVAGKDREGFIKMFKEVQELGPMLLELKKESERRKEQRAAAAQRRAAAPKSGCSGCGGGGCGQPS